MHESQLTECTSMNQVHYSSRRAGQVGQPRLQASFSVSFNLRTPLARALLRKLWYGSLLFFFLRLAALMLCLLVITSVLHQ
jgi:hypothetical protein